MEARNILVTGTNRGLGLEIVKQLLTSSTQLHKLFAACRDPGTATELNTLAESHPALRIVQLDVSEETRYESLASEVGEELGDEGLDVLLNNAAVMIDRGALQDVTSEELAEQFRINTIAPIMLTRTFMPLLRKATYVGRSSREGDQWRAAVFNMSSALASINLVSETADALKYGYRISKCGLDMATRLLHQEFSPEGILCVSLDPGWVRTDMGTEIAPMTPQESVEGLLKVMTEATGRHAGLLIKYDGTIQPF